MRISSPPIFVSAPLIFSVYISSSLESNRVESLAPFRLVVSKFFSTRDWGNRREYKILAEAKCYEPFNELSLFFSFACHLHYADEISFTAARALADAAPGFRLPRGALARSLLPCSVSLRSELRTRLRCYRN